MLLIAPRRVLCWLLAIGPGAVAVAQAGEAPLATARQQIAAGDWSLALATLLELPRVGPPEARRALAEQLNLVVAAAYQAGDFDAAQVAAEVALPLWRGLPDGTGDGDEASALGYRGSCRPAAGRTEAALGDFERALTIRRRLCGERDDEFLAIDLHNVAACLGRLGRAEAAVPLHIEAVAMRGRLVGDAADAEQARFLTDAAKCLGQAGRWADCLPMGERALAMWRRLYGDTPRPEVTEALTHVVDSLVALDRPGDARPHCERLVAMLRTLQTDADSLPLVRCLQTLTDIELACDDATAAAASAERALDMWARLPDPQEAEIAWCHEKLAAALLQLRRAAAASVHAEAALDGYRRTGGTPTSLAWAKELLARCLAAADRLDAALPLWREAAATAATSDDDDLLTTSLNNMAVGLWGAGRSDEALPLFEGLLARAIEDSHGADSDGCAVALLNVASCQEALGRTAEARLSFQRCVEMYERIDPDLAHAQVTTALEGLSTCLERLGDFAGAVDAASRALTLSRRSTGVDDRSRLARSLNNLCALLLRAGRQPEALAHGLEALALTEALGDRADPADVATMRNNVASTLDELGRDEEALPYYERALAGWQRLHAGQDHFEVARGLNNIATCLIDLARKDEAQAVLREALAMLRRLYGDRDHDMVANCMMNLAACLADLDEPAAALDLYQQSLAMLRRIHTDEDSQDVARVIAGIASCCEDLGRFEDALRRHEEALAMQRRLYGAADHPDVALAWNGLGECQFVLDRRAEALVSTRAACDMIERLRAAHAGSPMQQSFFDVLKNGWAFERLQGLQAPSDPAAALAAAERSRNRAQLDLLEHHAFDPVDAAIATAEHRGDDATVARLRRLRSDLHAAWADDERLRRELAAGGTGPRDAGKAPRARAEVLADLAAVTQRARQLGEERARLLAEEQPTTRTFAPAAIQAALADDEALLEFTITDRFSALYLVTRGAIEVFRLEPAAATLQRLLPGLLAAVSPPDQQGPRGRDPDTHAAANDPTAAARELFEVLMPDAAWRRVRACRRVFVAPHRALHRLPFELLVTEVVDGAPRYWLDAGPAIAYVPSGSVLAGLRQRPPLPDPPTRPREILVVGDPSLRGDAPLAPDAPAMRGESVAFDLAFGRDRIDELPQLRGARAEAEAIAATFRDHGAQPRLLLGPAATERAVFASAGAVDYLHFACHGIAEEYAGQSLSMLVLSQVAEAAPGDNGLLDLDDLLRRWRGRLDHCRLVVLSACRTHVGPTQRDDAPQALPVGFLFAGASRVVSTLWAVDDDSTRVLMTDCYRRMLDTGADPLQALLEAKRALRRSGASALHWAPFVLVGAPD